MYIYKLTQNDNRSDHAISSVIVVAENEDKARIMHPGHDIEKEYDFSKNYWEDGYKYYGWAIKPENVKIEKIGLAYAMKLEYTPKSRILSKS